MDLATQKLSVVILAAGKGTRMKSDLPKVLHRLKDKPLVDYPLDLAQSLGADAIILVVGHQADMVRREVSGRKGVSFALQEPQLGTGHAMGCAAKELPDFVGDVLVLYGDVPGLRRTTLEHLLSTHRQSGDAMTVLAMELPEPGHYGRLVARGTRLEQIVEYKDATEEQRKIKLVNSGIYLFKSQPLFAGLKKIKPENQQNEYYLTDMVDILRKAGQGVGYVVCRDPHEVSGVNSVEELLWLQEHWAGPA